MDYASLVNLTRETPCFDLALLVQAFGDRRESIRVQLSRWIQGGKVVALRRGMYALPDTWRRAPLPPALLANRLYRPSYLTGVWALGFYDMIPERVVVHTSVSPRVPRRFENAFGVFEYRHIKQEAFFGYVTILEGQQDVLVADPEKALIDHWHLAAGEWTPARLAEMRYQRRERVEVDRLVEYARRFRSPRLIRAASRWTALDGDEKGTVML